MLHSYLAIYMFGGLSCCFTIGRIACIFLCVYVKSYARVCAWSSQNKIGYQSSTCIFSEKGSIVVTTVYMDVDVLWAVGNSHVSASHLAAGVLGWQMLFMASLDALDLNLASVCREKTYPGEGLSLPKADNSDWILRKVIILFIQVISLLQMCSLT